MNTNISTKNTSSIISLLHTTPEGVDEDDGTTATAGLDQSRATNNLPASPEAQSHLAISHRQIADGYDSDGQVGPFFDAVMNEGPLETDEPSLPMVGVNDTAESPNNIQNDTENDVGKFIDIAENDLVKLKNSELKDELKKRGQSVAGKKSILQDRL
jgi:hypothetical protein